MARAWCRTVRRGSQTSGLPHLARADCLPERRQRSRPHCRLVELLRNEPVPLVTGASVRDQGSVAPLSTLPRFVSHPMTSIERPETTRRDAQADELGTLEYVIMLARMEAEQQVRVRERERANRQVGDGELWKPVARSE